MLWVVWIWDGVETRHAAESAAISKATLTGVVKTLEARGLVSRRVSETDRRLVNLDMTAEGDALMKELYPLVQRRRVRGRRRPLGAQREGPDP